VDDRIMCSCTKVSGPQITQPHYRNCMATTMVEGLPQVCGGKVTQHLAQFGWQLICENGCENPEDSRP
jgi:hypothetical protein